MKWLILIIMLVLLWCGGAWGATYYVDDTSGLDTNTGLTEALAWKSVAKVNTATLAQGDTILFKRGEDFGQNLVRLELKRLEITFADYGSGAKPIIHRVYGAALGDWSGTVISNLLFDSSGEANKAGGDIRQYSDLVISGCDFVNNDYEGLIITVYGGGTPDDIVITDSTFTGNGREGVTIQAETLTMATCTADGNGTLGAGRNNIELYPQSGASVYALTDCITTNATTGNDGLYADSISGEGTINLVRLTAYDNDKDGAQLAGINTVNITGGAYYDNGQYGLSFTLDSTTTHYVSDVTATGGTYYGNTLQGFYGGSDGDTLIDSIYAYDNGDNNLSFSSRNTGAVVVQDSVFSGGDSQGLGITTDAGATTLVTGCFAYHIGANISAGFLLHGSGAATLYGSVSTGYSVGIKTTETVDTNIINNTVFDHSSYCVELRSTGATVLKDNIMGGSGPVALYVHEDAVEVALTSDYNSFYGPTNNVQKLADAGNISLATWQAYADADQDPNSITTDPLLTADGKVGRESPCVGTGIIVDAVNNVGYEDYWGKHVLLNPGPNIGADQGAGAPTSGTGQIPVGGCPGIRVN